MGARLAVTLMQLAFVTWLPAAHMQHHADELPLRAPSQEGGNAPVTDLSSVCFVCAASVGAGTPAEPDLGLSATISQGPPAPPILAHPAPRLFIHVYSARAPPTLCT
jgi:hypothetical protein